MYLLFLSVAFLKSLNHTLLYHFIFSFSMWLQTLHKHHILHNLRLLREVTGIIQKILWYPSPRFGFLKCQHFISCILPAKGGGEREKRERVCCFIPKHFNALSINKFSYTTTLQLTHCYYLIHNFIQVSATFQRTGK